ncbi:carbohydrate ABC transporter permease [Amnibacterium flavum]|uniref:Sugar ABC transporter permease n=1 Tax=Amnibacterium flavum TaxID=2173173 RepID=A0A2V1HL84_9MICO|nr:sugar ABC transporter permease [Amnibacterium flavum]PVZ93328.1 sugar ABC transporter permease [Amnibacterium flavum]
MSTTTRPGAASPPKAGKTSGGGPRRRRRSLPNGLPWILPALIVSVGLLYYSIGYTGYISTLKWDGTSPNPESVGLDNYGLLFTDPIFWTALRNTVLFFLVTFGVQTALGVFCAVLLHSRIRLAVVYRVLIFLPVVLAPAIMAPVFRQIYAAGGQFNDVLGFLGLGFLAQPWLAQSSTALPVLMAITIWQWTGLNFILYFAAMGQIDSEILEAARIDGASNWRILVSIIWPGVRGTTIALAMLSAIGALKTFDIPYLVTLGGPNFATEFLGTFIYRESIPLAHVGYAGAISIMLLLLAIVMAFIFGRRRNSEER